MVEIKVKRLVPEAELPVRKHESDAGADVKAVSKHLAAAYSDGENVLDVVEYGTGLAFSIPKGYALDFRARSSVWKQGMMLCNGVGTIDEAYHDEVKAFFYKFAYGEYNIGDRIGQLVLQPYVDPREIKFVEVDELEFNENRGGGFGSTGLK